MRPLGRTAAVLAAGWLLVAPGGTSLDSQAQEGRPWESRAALAAAAPVALDARLTDPHGRVVRFRSDILERGPTLVTFTYLGCNAQCPISDVIAGGVETLLERSGRSEARIVTLTLDPTVRAANLRTHAELIGTGPRRTLLGGDLLETAPLLEGLGVRFGSLDDHALFFLIFDASGRFESRVELADATPESLVARLEAARGPARRPAR